MIIIANQFKNNPKDFLGLHDGKARSKLGHVISHDGKQLSNTDITSALKMFCFSFHSSRYALCTRSSLGI